MGIGFSLPIGLLLLAALPLLALALGRRSPKPRALSGRQVRLATATRLVLFGALVLAIAGLQVERTPAGQTLIVVADRSASLQRGLGGEVATVARIRDHLGSDDLLGVVVTGRDAFVEVPPRPRPELADFSTAVNPNYTDLEAGLRLASSILPSDHRGHVLLLSDGRQNLGDAAAQAALLHQQGVRVDVLPVQVPAGNEVRVDALRVPSSVLPESRALAEVQLNATVATSATLRVDVDGVPVDQRSLSLTPGDSSVGVALPPATPGFHRVDAVIDPVLDTLAENNVGEALMQVLGTQRVAIVEGYAGAGANLAAALRAGGGMAVDVLNPAQLPASAEGLAAYQSLVLVDVAARDLGEQRMASIQSAVRDLGIGLTTIGGPHTYGPGGFAGTPIEASLPISMNISDRPDKAPVAVVLVLESVESGAGDAVIRGAASAVVAHLSPRDYVGVTDALGGLIVPLTQVGDGKGVQAAIRGLQQFGDPPSYAPYITKAGDALAGHPEATRHVIVLGDGDSTPTPSALIDSLVRAGVTVSSVGVDIDHSPAQMATMQALAERGNGRFYRSESPSQVPDILLEETDQQLKPWIVEQSFEPALVTASPTLAGLDLASFPSLDGYVASTAKPGASVVLTSPQRDPVLAEWQYGLGRVVSWTSDIDGRWTAAMLRWPQAGKLLGNLVSATLPLSGDPDVSVTTSVQGDRGHVSVDLSAPAAAAANLAGLASVVGPSGAPLDVTLSNTAPGRFEADFPADQVGAYLLRIVLSASGRTVHTATAGLAVAYSPEFRFLGTDTGTLRAIASAGGGSVLDTPEAALTVPVPPVRVAISVAIPLLIMAALLLPLDVALRRLVLRSGDAAFWREAVPGRRRRRVVAEVPATLGRLRRRLDEHRAPRAGPVPASRSASAGGSATDGGHDLGQASPPARERSRSPAGATPSAAGAEIPAVGIQHAPAEGGAPEDGAQPEELAARLLAARRRRRR